jgi:hypothetical protein
MWCYSENSAQINLLVLLQYSCSRSVKCALRAFLTSVAPYENRLNGLPPTFVLVWRDRRICEVSWRKTGSCFVPSGSMMMLFSKQIHLTILSVLLKFFSIALFNYRHFSVRIPKILLPPLLACDSLQLKTCSSHDISFHANAFIKYVFRG